MDALGGHVALVTGGASGIGFSIAHALARAGAAVSVVDADPDAAVRAADAIGRECGRRSLGVTGDVSDDTDVARAAATTTIALGAPTILVNNAGIMAARLVPAEELSHAEFDRMLAVHVRGTFLMASAVLPEMKRRRFGRIINLSSILGLVGFPYRAAYSAAKAAILGFTRGLAVETARHGITVNAIAPGYILTQTLRERVAAGMLDHDTFAERTPTGRWGAPEEIARVVSFLADPASAYITGITLPVDGGLSMRGDPNEPIGDRQ